MAMTKALLQKTKDETVRKRPRHWIRVGYSTCGIAAGAKEVFDALNEEVRARSLDVAVMKCGCAGLCSAEPLVEVNTDGMPRVFYGKVTRDVAQKIVEEHVHQKKLVEGHIYQI